MLILNLLINVKSVDNDNASFNNFLLLYFNDIYFNDKAF